MRTLGLIGGMSWESTAIYYRLLNEGVRARLGGLHSARLVLWSCDFEDIARRQAEGDWDGAGRILGEAGRALRAAGADGIVLCTNTMHKVASFIEEAAGLPFLHLADVTAAAIRAHGCRRPLLLATRYTMEDDFYKGRLRDRHGITVAVPDAEGRSEVHRVIYEELCRGVVDATSKARVLDVIARSRGEGCDGVILGCTELGMLLGPTDSPDPVLDTTRLHVEAALDFALAA
ncbi:aspartate/glutamate racemase family protein [uncultured Alsobacter sp.]|uniref:aspartate/glutamate racemase family protein n=1 Tax=uncultured Alsobacter sp. TaxID=1748258 RepID=UPI0026013B5C|nr:aspartate/glutamate racemase family protein [uncultured Alsobacter sp.]